MNKRHVEFFSRKLPNNDGEIKEDVNKRRDTSHLWTVRLNIIKATILSKLISRVNAIQIILMLGGFYKTDRPILMFEINRI